MKVCFHMFHRWEVSVVYNSLCPYKSYCVHKKQDPKGKGIAVGICVNYGLQFLI